MARKVTIKDIARELDTTYSTVSRALNDHPGISEEKRKRIIAKASELGYEPNLTARQLRSGGSNTIGMIVPEINRVFFSNTICAVENEVTRWGYNVIICQSGEQPEQEKRNIRVLLANQVAGIIMSLSKESVDPAVHREIIDRKIPFVMFDRVFDDMPGCKILNDNLQSAYLVTRHLLEQGYRRIIHMAGPFSSNIYRERAEGYRRALREAGLPVHEEEIFPNVLTIEAGRALTGELLDHDRAFDAVFSASDFSALGSMKCLEARGVKVPEEVGVTGFANEPFTELVQLTSVEQHSAEMGKVAAHMVLESIQNGSEAVCEREIMVKNKVIIRHSSLKSN